MSEAVLDTFRLPRGANSAAAPSDDSEWRGELIRAQLGMPKAWLHRFDDRVVEFDTPLIHSLGGATAAQAAFRDVLIFDRDEDGDLVVFDPLGVAYGVAPTIHDAAAQWEEAAREHLEDLAAEEHRLGPRMHEQLLFLRKLFG